MLSNRIILAKPFSPVYENDVDSLIPELWANEGLAILVENMVASALVYRNFENTLQAYGDVVHVSRPGEFTAKRKMKSDNVVIQDAIATDVQVPLNQHFHTSFLIRDGEEDRAFPDLVKTFLRPAVISLAQAIDRIVLDQYVHFMRYSAGTLTGFASANARSTLLALRGAMNTNKAPVDGRNLVLNSLTETTLLNNDLFTAANQVGDDGSALRNASLGRKLGFDIYMDQNMPVVTSGNTTSAGAINLSAGYAAGSTTTIVDGITGIIATGTWFSIAGDLIPHQVTAHTETLGNTTSITFTPPLATAVVNDGVVTFVSPGAVNLVAGYAAGWAKEITVDGFTVGPQRGQAVSFGTDTTHIYTVLDVNGLVGITLDRPLDAAIVNDATVNLGPAGAYNFAFHKNAIALVVRPLKQPKQGAGALSYVATWNDMAMRITIAYLAEKQGHLVTADLLAGIAVLDEHLGAVFFG